MIVYDIPPLVTPDVTIETSAHYVIENVEFSVTCTGRLVSLGDVISITSSSQDGQPFIGVLAFQII